MSILTFLQDLITPNLKPNKSGTFSFTDVRLVDDILELVEEFKHMPEQEGIDKDWIIEALTEINDDYWTTNLNNEVEHEAADQFIELYQKIGVGKKLYHEGKAEELRDHLLEMYPNIEFDGMKAVGYYDR